MTWELYTAFILATSILILIPGPNVALIVANSVAHGTRYGLVTVAGTSSAMVVQLASAVLGLTGLLSVLATGFEILRWLGVAYLAYLGLAAWRAPAADLAGTTPQIKSTQDMFWRGFFVSMTNPKTLLFYAAFLPQFINKTSDQASQLVLLAGTFLAIAALGDSIWALAAQTARRALGLSGRLLNRLTGGLLLTAAAGLALARKP
jgi:homoserine/homoserine lactone efflux protein